MILGALVLVLMEAIHGKAMVGVGLTLVVGGAVLSLANGPAQFLAMCEDHARVGRRLGSPVAHLGREGRLAVIAALIVPLVLAVTALILAPPTGG